MRRVSAPPPEKRAPFLLTAGGWPYMLVPFIPIALVLEFAHAGAVALFATSALGVRQSSIVLRYIDQTRAAGIGVIFITHNVHHAYLIGDRFTVLERGRNTGTVTHDEISVDELEKKMAGGKELERLASEFQRAKAVA